MNIKLFDMIAEFETKGEAKVKRSIDTVTQKAETMGSKLKASADKLSSFGSTMSSRVTGPALAAFALITEGSKELRDELAKLDAAIASTGGMDKKFMRGMLTRLQEINTDTGANVEVLNNLMAAGLDSSQIEKAVELVSGASIKFQDTLKMEGVADGLQETLATGKAIGPFSELLERSGVNLEGFDEELQRIPTHAERVNYVLQTMSRLGLKETTDAFREANEVMIDSRRSTHNAAVQMAILGNTLLPLKTMVMEFLTDLLQKFNELNPAQQETILKMMALVVVIGPLSQATAGLMTVYGNLGKMMKWVVDNPMMALKGGLVAANIAVWGYIVANKEYAITLEGIWNRVLIGLQTFRKTAIENDMKYGNNYSNDPNWDKEHQDRIDKINADIEARELENVALDKERRQILEAKKKAKAEQAAAEAGMYDLLLDTNEYKADEIDWDEKFKDFYKLPDMQDELNDSLEETNELKTESNKLDREAIELAKKLRYSKYIEIERDLTVGKFAKQTSSRQTDMQSTQALLEEQRKQNQLLEILIGVEKDNGKNNGNYINLNSNITKELKTGFKRSSTIIREAGVV